MTTTGSDADRFIVLLRHGIAEDPTPDKADAERSLTADGHAEMKQISKGLAVAFPRVQAIYASPLLRAMQTATWVSKAFRSRVPVTAAEELAPGASPASFARFVLDLAARRAIIVGHEPGLTEALRSLIGPLGRVELQKAGCYGVRVGEEGVALEWLLSPRILRKLAEIE